MNHSIFIRLQVCAGVAEPKEVARALYASLVPLYPEALSFLSFSASRYRSAILLFLLFTIRSTLLFAGADGEGGVLGRLFGASANGDKRNWRGCTGVRGSISSVVRDKYCIAFLGAVGVDACPIQEENVLAVADVGVM